MEYTSFKCKCKREFILNTDELESSVRQGIYITCPYCNSKNVHKEKETDSLKECMKQHHYVRSKNGALRQVE